MPRNRRTTVLLAILAVVSVVALVQYWPTTPPPVAVTGAPARPAGRPSTATSITAPDVHLQALSAERPRPQDEPERNLFRFKPKAAPPRAPAAARPAGPATPPVAQAPAGPPPLAPIAMRFIGLLEATEHAEKIAVLTDGRGIYHGREGDIIEGRYRILKIGVESVDVAYLDGRGRQTIRLSGS